MGLYKIYSYALLTKRGVKMTGCWPNSFFLRFYGLRRSLGPSYFKHILMSGQDVVIELDLLSVMTF